MKNLFLFLISLLPLAIASCGGDDKDEPIVNPENPNVDNPNDGNQEQIYEHVFPSAADCNLIFESYSAGWCYVRVNWCHDGGGMLSNPRLQITTNGAKIKAVDVDKVSAITDIKDLPTGGWVNYPCFYGADLYKGYIVEIYKDNYFRYFRLFISSFDKSASGEVVGVRMKYQKFNPS